MSRPTIEQATTRLQVNLGSRPALARQTPHRHQTVGEEFCRNNKRVILADDMGAGKTLPAIRASEGRTIIICPASVKANWRNEILRERPGARVLILSGIKSSLIEDDVDFIILNYDIAEAWRDSLIAWRPDTCIADEAHTCRNRRTARFQATLKIIWACDRRYLLTGTPIVNCPRDLVALINMLGKLKSCFGGWRAFVERYCGAFEGDYGLDTSGASNLGELHEKLYTENIMLRRMKHEVLTLPQKTRRVTRITIDPSGFGEYANTEQALVAEIKENPALLHNTSFQCLAGVRHAVGQCKIKSAIARIKEFLAGRSAENALSARRGEVEKLVVFAHHRSVREAIAAAFPNAIVLNAETTDRDAQVELFQTSTAHRLFITSPRFGGLGITLTAANYVLIVEFDFTSAVMLQAEDRVHRLGQSSHVTVEYLYADATVVGFMLALINRKQRIFDKTCDGLAEPDYLLRLSKRGDVHFERIKQEIEKQKEEAEKFPWAVNKFEFRGARIFKPGEGAEYLRPFAFVQELFETRGRIIAETKAQVAAWRKEFGEPYAGPRPHDTDKKALQEWMKSVDQFATEHGGDEPYNLLEKAIKLVLNSIYGKMGQSLGTPGKLPVASNPFYAGAITAGCRAQLHMAALNDPWRVVAFATDAILSAGPMRGLEHSPYKIIGTWEHAAESDTEEAAVFLHPGLNTFFDLTKKEHLKMRGCKVEFGRDFLSREVRKKWKTGPRYYVIDGHGLARREVTFAEWRDTENRLAELWSPYPQAERRGRRLWKKGVKTEKPENILDIPNTNLVTFGAALISAENWPKCGVWKTCNRGLDLDRCGVKRVTCRDTSRADCLSFVPPKDHPETNILSLAYYPQWLDEETGEVLLERDGEEEAEARFGE